MGKGSLVMLRSVLDIYGWPIQVNYRGQHIYQTWMGALCSIITAILIVLNSASLITALLNGSR